MKKRLIRSVSVLLALLTVLSCFSAVSFGAVERLRPAMGDVNADGAVNISDCTQLQKYIAGMVELDEAELAIADTNGDGEINISDATMIQKVIAGIESFAVTPGQDSFTRGEWVTFIVDKFDMAEVEIDPERGCHFRDIADSEYAVAIETAYAFNILPAIHFEYADGYRIEDDLAAFDPDAVATREFAAVTVYNAMGFQGSPDCDFADEDAITYTACAATMVNQGFMTAGDNRFRPEDPVTGADKAMIEARIDYYNGRAEIAPSEEKCEYTYADNVKTVTAEPNELHPFEEDGVQKVFISLPKTAEVTALTVGSVFVVPATETTPSGGAYKVAEIDASSGDAVELVCTMPELEEVFASVDVASVQEANVRDIVPAEGVTVREVSEPVGGAQPDKSAEAVGAETVDDLEFDIDVSSLAHEFSESIGVVNLKFRITQPKIRCTTRCVYDGISIKDLLLSVSESIGISVIGTVDNNMSSVNAARELNEPSIIELGALPPIYLGSTPFFVQPVMFLYVDIYGRLKLGFTVEGKKGIEYLNGQLRKIYDFDLADPSLELNASVQAGIGLRLLLNFGGSFLYAKLAGFDAKLGLAASSTVTVHLDERPYLTCYDFTVYLALTFSLSDDTILTDFLKSRNTTWTYYLFNAQHSPFIRNMHCESTGDGFVNIFGADAKPSCTYQSGKGDVRVTFYKSDATGELTLDTLRLYDDSGKLITAKHNLGVSHIFDDLPVGDYHVEAWSFEGDAGYFGEANVTVTKNGNADCILSGSRVTPAEENGSLEILCRSSRTGETLTVSSLELYDQNDRLVKTLTGGQTVFENIPAGSYYVAAIARGSGVDYSGKSSLIYVGAGNSAYHDFSMKSSDEDEEDSYEEKHERKDFTFDFDSEAFQQPYYHVLVSTKPFEDDNPYKTVDGTWWFYPTYGGDDGWYVGYHLNGWRYLTDDTLPAGTYYIAVFVSEDGDSDHEERLLMGTVSFAERRSFYFRFNPGSGRLICETSTRNPADSVVIV